MGCSVCGVSVDSPCAIICYSDCSVCWVDAPAMLARAAANGATLKQVAELLNKASPERRLAYEGAGTEVLNETYTGTLDEVIKTIGLKVAAAKAR